MGKQILGIDYGRVRVGLACTDADGSSPQRLKTLANATNLIDRLQTLVIDQHISKVVVGLPRGIEGEETAQTALTREFVRKLKAAIKVPVELQDEFGTSAMARERLNVSPQEPDTDGLVDQEAAVIILEDHLAR